MGRGGDAKGTSPAEGTNGRGSKDSAHSQKGTSPAEGAIGRSSGNVEKGASHAKGNVGRGSRGKGESVWSNKVDELRRTIPRPPAPPIPESHIAPNILEVPKEKEYIWPELGDTVKPRSRSSPSSSSSVPPVEPKAKITKVAHDVSEQTPTEGQCGGRSGEIVNAVESVSGRTPTEGQSGGKSVKGVSVDDVEMTGANFGRRPT